mmetsp:Transcript_28045/g.47150  ORF Transcript_28045/g.47150 Transcript_28045/m.47150 type:complete len:1859 (+) Transcript_28045:236-5812(+)
MNNVLFGLGDRASHIPPCGAVHEWNEEVEMNSTAEMKLRWLKRKLNEFGCPVNNKEQGISSIDSCYHTSLPSLGKLDANEFHRNQGLLNSMTFVNILKNICALRTEYVMRIARPILSRLMSHPRNLNTFNQPVDPVALSLPTYFDIVHSPMDLGTVLGRLRGGYYRSVQSCFDDIELVFRNAMLFNESTHIVHKMAKDLLDDFRNEVQQLEEKCLREYEKKMQHNCSLCCGSTCYLCGEKCKKFESASLNCQQCGQRIKKNGVFHVAVDGSVLWCQKCYISLPPLIHHGSIPPSPEQGKQQKLDDDHLQTEVVLLSRDDDDDDNEAAETVDVQIVDGGNGAIRASVAPVDTTDPSSTTPLLKRNLLKRRADEELSEPWVECDSCGNWYHQICAFYSKLCANNAEVHPKDGAASSSQHGEESTTVVPAFCCPFCVLLQGASSMEESQKSDIEKSLSDILGPWGSSGGRNLPATGVHCVTGESTGVEGLHASCMEGATRPTSNIEVGFDNSSRSSSSKKLRQKAVAAGISSDSDSVDGTLSVEVAEDRASMSAAMMMMMMAGQEEEEEEEDVLSSSSTVSESIPMPTTTLSSVGCELKNHHQEQSLAEDATRISQNQLHVQVVPGHHHQQYDCHGRNENKPLWSPIVTVARSKILSTAESAPSMSVSKFVNNPESLSKFSDSNLHDDSYDSDNYHLSRVPPAPAAGVGQKQWSATYINSPNTASVAATVHPAGDSDTVSTTTTTTVGLPVPRTGYPDPHWQYRAASLPHTQLGDFLETLCKDLLIANGFLDAAQQITIRMTSNKDHQVEVPKPVVENIPTTDGCFVPDAMAYRQKCILLFQEIDGIDVCLFSLYVHEFDRRCPAPNTSTVYIAYLDSVDYFRPVEARTMVYQEIVAGYLKWAQMRGFTSAHIWSCPPHRGDNFIFNAHPTHQRYPSRERLNSWYRSILHRCTALQIVAVTGNLWQQYFAKYLRREVSHPVARQAARNSFIGTGKAVKKSVAKERFKQQQQQQREHGDANSVLSTNSHSCADAKDETSAEGGCNKSNAKELPLPCCPPIFDGDYWVQQYLHLVRIRTQKSSRTLSQTAAAQEQQQIYRKFRDLLRTFMTKEPEAGPFLLPVDYVGLKIPHYPKVVKRPMDFATVKNKLNSGLYATALMLVQDVRLIFENAKLFNPSHHPIYRSAVCLLEKFELNVAITVKGLLESQAGELIQSGVNAGFRSTPNYEISSLRSKLSTADGANELLSVYSLTRQNKPVLSNVELSKRTSFSDDNTANEIANNRRIRPRIEKDVTVSSSTNISPSLVEDVADRNGFARCSSSWSSSSVATTVSTKTSNASAADDVNMDCHNDENDINHTGMERVEVNEESAGALSSPAVSLPHSAHDLPMHTEQQEEDSILPFDGASTRSYEQALAGDSDDGDDLNTITKRQRLQRVVSEDFSLAPPLPSAAAAAAAAESHFHSGSRVSPDLLLSRPAPPMSRSGSTVTVSSTSLSSSSSSSVTGAKTLDVAESSTECRTGRMPLTYTAPETGQDKKTSHSEQQQKLHSQQKMLMKGAEGKLVDAVKVNETAWQQGQRAFVAPAMGRQDSLSIIVELSKRMQRQYDDLFVIHLAPSNLSDTDTVQSKSLHEVQRGVEATASVSYRDCGITSSSSERTTGIIPNTITENKNNNNNNNTISTNSNNSLSAMQKKRRGRISHLARKTPSIHVPGGLRSLSDRCSRILNAVASDTSDPDPPIHSPLTDSRHTFLEMCQFRHYQFDSLRRAKHSSLMILFHLQHPFAKCCRPVCSHCGELLRHLRWHCDECPDYDICGSCYDASATAAASRCAGMSKDSVMGRNIANTSVETYCTKHPHTLTPYRVSFN